MIDRVTARIGRIGADHEWVIVLLMVASALLSGISFWQATEFADRSTDLANQARFTAGQAQRSRSALQAMIAHDQTVVVDCTSAIALRDAALNAYSTAFDETLVPVIVEAERTELALSAVMIEASGCADYPLDLVLDWARLLNSSGAREQAGSQALLRQSAAVAAGESVALGSAVLYAVALLLLTLADSVKRTRWIRTWVIGAIAAFAAAAALAIRAFTAEGGAGAVAIALSLGVLPLLALTAWAFARTPLGRPGRASDGRGPESRRFGRSRHLDRDARWWAEILGAVTLVFFATSALGLSDASRRAREALVEADSLTVQARRVLELGEQSALAALAYVAELAELDASVAATTQQGGEDAHPRSGPHMHARDAVLRRWHEEQADWQRLLEEGAETAANSVVDANTVLGTGPTCIDPDAAFIWQQTAYREVGDSLPVRLLVDLRTEPDALRDVVTVSTSPSIRCEVWAELRSGEAQGWNERSSSFTVALVALGLAGFLFALAADADRSLTPRRWLLIAATCGLVGGITVYLTALSNAPVEAPATVADRGTAAYAASAVAMGIRDCPRARAEGDAAREALRGFPRTDVQAAMARTCSAGSLQLLGPALAGSDLDAFTDGFERAYQAGMKDAAVPGNLGWARLLNGLSESGPQRATYLEHAARLADEALQRDPTSPVQCFNLALATLARGDDAHATARYQQALEGLRADAPQGGRCAARYTDLTLQRYMVLTALADLELLPTDTPGLQSIRDLLVSGRIPTGVASTPAGLRALELAFDPLEVALAKTAGVNADVAIVWYYRVTDDEPWGVLVSPSLVTIQPGGDAIDTFHAVGDVAPDGEYRADIYVDGRRVWSLAERNDWWERRGLSSNDFSRVELTDLGVSALIPKGWQVRDQEPGFEAIVAGDGGLAAFRRSDAVAPADLELDLASWRSRVVDATDVEWVDKADVEEDLPADFVVHAGWFLGFDAPVVQTGGAARRSAIGHTQYLTPPNDDFGAEETGGTSHDSCRGTAIAAVVDSQDPGLTETIWASLRLPGGIHTVDAGDAELADPFVSPQFSLDVPSGWTGVGCPGYLSATAPGKAQSVIASVESFTGTLDEFATAGIEELRKGLAVFEEEEIAQTTLATGLEAETIRYTWTTDDGLAVRQTQVYAVANGVGHRLTYTTRADEPHDGPDGRLLLDTYGPVAPPSIVPAECATCGSEELRERQVALDRIANRLAVVDATYCTDATGRAEEGSTAMIGCTYPGGFSVDFALWPTPDSLDRFTERFTSVAGATVQEWSLSDPGPTVGTTVEFVTDGQARMSWTYDEYLISANAAFSSDDQARLNNWWETSAALLRQ